MGNATRIPNTGRNPAANPLANVHLSDHDRRQAELDMRTAEQLVDFVFGVIEGTQSLVRRLRRA
jgi:hypothetical protein